MLGAGAMGSVSARRSVLLVRVTCAACAILMSGGPAESALQPHFLVVSANYRDDNGKSLRVQ